MRGGKRQGSGRKKGSVTDKTSRRTQAALAALEQGISPLEVMLENMIWARSQIEKLGDNPIAEIVAGYRKMAQDAAVDAAPYVHPKLAAVQHSGDQDNPVKTTLEILWGASNASKS